MVTKLNAKVTTYRHGQIVGDASWQAYARVLDAGEQFEAGANLRGNKGAPGQFGRLDVSWHSDVKRADYVVYSYMTPIAWRVPGEGWVIPARGTFGFDVETRTTVCHINKIRTAVGSLGKYRQTPAA
jgi:hypothetical protein